MEDCIGSINLDSINSISKEELIAMIRQALTSLDEDDQREILEIAEDMFNEEDLKILFGIIPNF